MNLIVGATGTVGGRVAEKLLNRGERVRALVRPQAPGREQGPHTPPERLEQLGAELVPGDLTETSSLPGALEGVRCVIATANTAKRPPDFERVDWQGTRDLIDAAKAAGVERFVYLSAHGAAPDSPVPLFSAKGKVEEHLKASGLSYIILRPVPFMEDWIGFALGAQLAASGELRLVGGGEKAVSFIATEDVADLMTEATGHPEARDQVFTLSAGYATYRDIASMIEEVQGREIPVRSVNPGEAIPGLPAGMVQLWGGMAMGPEMRLATPEVAARFGLSLRPVEAFVERAFARA